MSEKISKAEAAIIVTKHLQEYAHRVGEVVADYNKIEDAQEVPKAGKVEFAAACMKDVSTLTEILTGFLTETLESAGVSFPSTPKESPAATEADVIELDAYRNNGGLLN